MMAAASQNQPQLIVMGNGKRNTGHSTVMLESEETGFSAIEEEVKSRDLNQRPTVYAGMANKESKKTHTINTMIDMISSVGASIQDDFSSTQNF